MSREQALRVSDEVIFEILDDEAVLLHMASGVYYRLNRTGARAWKLLEDGADADHIVATLADEFEAPVAQITKDVRALLADLVDNGLVRPS